MTDVKHALDSANQCTEAEIGTSSGAGANKGSRADMVLIATTNLSELVWSQHKGLSLQHVASSLPDKKASLLWNTESFNVIISSPKHANDGEHSNARDSAEEDPTLLQLKQNNEEKRSTSGTLLGSPSTTIGRPLSLIGIHEQKSGSFGDVGLPNGTDEVVLGRKDGRLSDDREVGICLPGNSKSSDVLRLENCAVDINQLDNREMGKCLPRNNNSYCNFVRPETGPDYKIHDKNFDQGTDNCGPSAESLSCYLKWLKPDLAHGEVKSASNVQTSPPMENSKISSIGIISAQDYGLAKYGSPVKPASSSRSSECGDADLAVDTAEVYTSSRILQHLTASNPFSGQRSGEVGDVQSLNFGHRNGVGMPVVLHPTDKSKDRTWQASHREKSRLVGSLSDCNMNNLNWEKGKEHAVSNTEESESISKESEDSQESVESCNSKRPISIGKRSWSYDSKMPVEYKRMKKESNQSSCSNSTLRKDSSFMNWILTITKGFSGNDHAASLALAAQTSHHTKGNFKCPPMSHEKSKDISTSCRNTGFKSIFQALFHPILGIENSTSDDLDHQKEADASKKLQANEHFYHGIRQIPESVGFNLHSMDPTPSKKVNSDTKENDYGEQFNIDCLHVVCDRDGVELQREAAMSSDRLNQGTPQVVEFSPTVMIISSTDIKDYERRKNNGWQACNLNKMGSTSSSARIDSQSPSQGKETANIVPVTNSSPNLMANNRSGSLDNFWISRLSPKVSTPSRKSVQCNHNMDLTRESLTNNHNMLDPLSQNDVSCDREQKNSENCCVPYMEAHGDAVDCKAQGCTFCPTNSSGLRKEADQKLKSKINPILPSQRSKNKEPIASTFAKRLDALRHIKPLKAPNDLTSATTTCDGDPNPNIRIPRSESHMTFINYDPA